MGRQAGHEPHAPPKAGSTTVGLAGHVTLPFHTLPSAAASAAGRPEQLWLCAVQ